MDIFTSNHFLNKNKKTKARNKKKTTRYHSFKIIRILSFVFTSVPTSYHHRRRKVPKISCEKKTAE